MAYEDELATLMDEIMFLEHQLHGEKRKNRALERKIADCEENCVEIQVLHQELIKEKRAKTALKEVAKKDAELDILQHQAAAAYCEEKKYADLDSLQDELENQQHEKEALGAKVAQSNEALQKVLDDEKCGNTAVKNDVSLLWEANCANKDIELQILQQQLNKEKSEKLALEAKVVDLEFKVIKSAKCVRVYVLAYENYCLTVRDGHVILAQSKGNDLHQFWIKDVKYARGEKDCFGSIGFALVNMATGQAMKPIESMHTWNPVQLVPYNADRCDRSILWSHGQDLGNSYRAIRQLTNPNSNLDADRIEVQDRSNVGLYRWLNGTNQLWKIVPEVKIN